VRPDRLWPDVFMNGPAASSAPPAGGALRRRLVRLRTQPRRSPAGAQRQPEEPSAGCGPGARRRTRRHFLAAGEPASFESYANTLRAQAGAQFVEAVLKEGEHHLAGRGYTTARTRSSSIDGIADVCADCTTTSASTSRAACRSTSTT